MHQQTYKSSRDSNDIKFMVSSVLEGDTSLGKLPDRVIPDVN
jgi:hypothetical protein